MAVYVIYERTELLDADPAKWQPYLEGFGPIIAQYGGKVLAGTERIDTVEGEWHPRFLAIFELEDKERFQAWYDSPEYTPLKQVRHQLTRGRAIVVEGTAP